MKFGDYANSYSTTSNDQNKNMETGKIYPVASLDINVKNDLRRSHFILGNTEPNYNTIFKSEFFNKYDLKDKNAISSKSIEKELRKHSYILGNDVPDYKSETQAKYIAPIGYNLTNENKISSHELQKSHYVFGNYNDPWGTTSQASYYPKEFLTKKYTKDISRTNFVLGEDRTDFRSVSQDVFVPHKYIKNNEMNEISQDLRSKILFI
jgi:hypothetical protein